MSVDRVAALLEPIQARLEAADLNSLDYGPTQSDGYHIFPSDSDSAIAFVNDQYVASLFAHAPTDQARLLAAVQAVMALAEQWRYKGEFGWGAWQEGHGPDPEGAALDHASSAIRSAVEAALGGG